MTSPPHKLQVTSKYMPWLLQTSVTARPLTFCERSKVIIAKSFKNQRKMSWSKGKRLRFPEHSNPVEERGYGELRSLEEQGVGTEPQACERKGSWRWECCHWTIGSSGFNAKCYVYLTTYRCLRRKFLTGKPSMVLIYVVFRLSFIQKIVHQI